MCDTGPVPPSPCARPLLSALHLWRVTPTQESLRKIIRPSKGQLPIVLRATRMAGRKVVLSVWAVSDGEAITVSVYDHKAVQNLEITLLCGWWAELGITGLKSMAPAGLSGLAAYLVQSISLQIPQPDRKGRVDMSKASLQFSPGPPPPPFEFGPSQFNPRNPSDGSEGGTTLRPPVGGRMASRVVWRGIRTLRRRAVLLACARNGPSMMIVRGWDSSMAWRMTNVITFHEDDWKTWKDVTEPIKVATASFFATAREGDEQRGPQHIASHGPARSKGQDQRDKGDDIRQGSSTAATTLEGRADSSTDSGAAACISDAGSADETQNVPGSSGTVIAPKRSPITAVATDQASTDRLCQAIADRVEVRSEGRGGKIALRTTRWRGAGEANAGSGSGGSKQQDAAVQRAFLSHKDMEARIKHLDEEKERAPPAGAGLGGGPRRPLEDHDGSIDEWLVNLPGARSMKAYARRRGLDGKIKSMEEVVEQAVRKWKNLGKALCRLLRMSDYWYGFAFDGALSGEERAARRISVLQQILEMRGVGRTAMKTLVLAIAERYPRSVWSRFRQLMRQPRAERKRRDMAVCAVLLGEIDNQFFKYTTAGWPFSRLVDLASDSRLVQKPALSVLYEEGETAPRTIDSETTVTQAVLVPSVVSIATKTTDSNSDDDPRVASGSSCNETTSCSEGGKSRVAAGPSSTSSRMNSSIGGGGSSGGGGVQGTRPPQQQPQEQEERWTVGAYVIVRGSVNLYILERGPAAMLPTPASQDDLATKASRGQPMYRPRPPAEWEAADVAVEAQEGQPGVGRGAGLVGRRQRRAFTEHLEAVMSGRGAEPRRARTRNMAPRWKACRLGAGALFGDRPEAGSNPTTTTGLSQPPGVATEPPGAGPALETAVTAEETELLEIGVTTYRRLLAAGVREQEGRAVAVLRATGAMDGVPTQALARICRYGTERSTGPQLANPPLLNPSLGRVFPGREQGKAESAFGFPRGEDNGNDYNDSVMCRKGTFRGTVFFVMEGHGEVILGGGETQRFDGRRDEGGGSSTESLLAAAAFGNRRAPENRRKRGRRRGTHVGGGSNCGVGGGGDGGGSSTERQESTSGFQEDDTSIGESSALTWTGMSWQGPPDLPGSTATAGGTTPATTAAAHGRSDITGTGSTAAIEPSVASNTTVQAMVVASAPAAAASTPRVPDGSGTKHRDGSSVRLRPGLVATTDPSAITRDPASAVPAPVFPGLHKASLVAGPGGLRCLTVGLAVLQKVCPPVYRRLARVVSERYLEWVTEARRKNEEDWQESLESESVHSLSRSFYDSFAKGNCSGSIAGKGPNGVESSVGWISSAEGGRGSSSVLGFGDRAGSDGDELTIEAATLGMASSNSISGSGKSNKSIFELSRRYVGLALCSSARNVVPVRLGRVVVPAQRKTPSSSTSPHRSRQRRPVPPPPVAAVASNNNNTSDDGTTRRRVSPRSKATFTVISRAARRHCFAPAPASAAGAGVGSHAPSTGTITDGRQAADQTKTKSPPRTNTGPISTGSASVYHTHHQSPRGTGGSPDNTGKTMVHSCGGSVTGGDGSVFAGSNGRRGGGDGGGGGGSVCSRGHRCGSSLARGVTVPSERLGTEWAAANVSNLLAKYHQLETYDCPVSPFSDPPSWADIPPLAVIEPPGYSPSSNTPTCAAAGIGAAMLPGERPPEVSGASPANETAASLPSSPLHVEDGAPTEAAAVATRPAEKTVFQIVTSRRRPSYGWGWKRPPGQKGGARKRVLVPGSTTVPSPSLLGRERPGRTNMSAVPPTS
ncbi:hypothetical protein Esi_0176_0057 [Ectocarpus siliculosus]|uniref:Uncharacterized protein n=1 Tax=Ectocarpus siliculosus TaxID=2880 RepID=D8LGS7_ECTSI|nr:hypothetical protein Esi_0176_0057 [Ectocarpus siliculosus]|eukprot:CBN79097.1 hypothetical protein Esi_0176_0057 [Ectocarpus siliculosus]